MTPGARVAAAIAVLDRWWAGSEGLDRVLAAWGRESRYAGSGDRRAVADLAYDAVRRLRSALWAGGVGALPPPGLPLGRPALLGSLRVDGTDPATLFTGAGHAPAPLAPHEGADLGPPPPAVVADLPDWALRAADLTPEDLARLRARAPLFLRVNRLRADPETALAALAADGVAARPGPLAEGCLEVTEGARRVASSRAYLEGLVEIQDAASQAAAAFAEARPGETVLDYCAGGGGKTLALAAAMEGRGRLLAHDAAPARLAQLPPRAARAGVSVACLTPAELPGLTADLVFVDAPCSGSGAWARNPDAKWRLTEADLATYAARQDAILAQAATHVAPGGRLVYATCSLFEVENGARMAAFLHAHPQARLVAERRWRPAEGGDGFYAARISLS